MRNCTTCICVAKTKALISFAITAKLICAFVFAYAKCCLSHGEAQLSNRIIKSRLFDCRAKSISRGINDAGSAVKINTLMFIKITSLNIKINI